MAKVYFTCTLKYNFRQSSKLYKLQVDFIIIKSFIVFRNFEIILHKKKMSMLREKNDCIN